MKTVLYARVSTLNQTIAHQRSQAEAAGFLIDEGMSSVSPPLAGLPFGDCVDAAVDRYASWHKSLGVALRNVDVVAAQIPGSSVTPPELSTPGLPLSIEPVRETSPGTRSGSLC